MRTTIDLDDKLVAEAFRHTNVTTKKALVHLALEEFVRARKRLDVRDLLGHVELADDYDHKALREDDSGP